jgi:hypothetical protein
LCPAKHPDFRSRIQRRILEAAFWENTHPRENEACKETEGPIQQQRAQERPLHRGGMRAPGPFSAVGTEVAAGLSKIHFSQLQEGCHASRQMKGTVPPWTRGDFRGFADCNLRS